MWNQIVTNIQRERAQGNKGIPSVVRKIVGRA